LFEKVNVDKHAIANIVDKVRVAKEKVLQRKCNLLMSKLLE